jgi:hypothetical protein
VALGQVVGLTGAPGEQPRGVVEQGAVLQGRGGLARQDAEHRAVGLVDLPARRGPGDEAADHPSVELHRNVHVPPVRLGVVAAVVVRGTADDGQQVLADPVRHPTDVRPLRAVRSAHQVAGAGFGELAVDEGEQHPVGGQVLGRSLDDGPDQRLGSLGGAHQRRRDPLQRRDHPAQPLRVGAVLGEVVRLPRAQAGEGVEVRWARRPHPARRP